MHDSPGLTGGGYCCHRRVRCLRATYSPLRKLFFITPLDRVRSAGRFSKNTFPHIAILREFMESGDAGASGSTGAPSGPL